MWMLPSLHNACALRRTDESIYSEVGQTHLNTWQKLQQLTPSGFACIAFLPKLKLQPTYIVTLCVPLREHTRATSGTRAEGWPPLL